MVKCVIMKKLLTLVVLVAGVALFAGCMDKPATTEEITTPTVEEVTTPVVEEVVTTETTGTVETTTTEVAPEATAE